MNFIEAIENAQEKISKLGKDLNDVRFEIRRTSWGGGQLKMILKI